MFGMPEIRSGFSMLVEGKHLNRPDLHIIAADLGIRAMDVVIKDGRLVIYNTSAECQEIIDDNALASFVAMAIDISPENISDIQEVKPEAVQ